MFAPYVVTSIIADPVHGQALVASGAKYAGWIVALTAPLLGAVVDRMGPRKPWLIATVTLMLPLMVALWWARPGGTGLSVGAIIAILAALGGLFAYTQTLHNALLLPAAGSRNAGAASGLALAFGNFVSVAMLGFVLWGFALPGKVAWGFVPTAPLFGLDVASHQQDRIVPVLAALALAFGTLPLLAFVPDVASTGVRFGAAVRLALADLKSLVLGARGHRDGLVYLGATLLFTDGLTGILIFSGVYAAGVMGWQSLELLAYGMILCVFAVGGGLLAGWLDGRIGPKRALTLEICGVVVSQLLSLGNTKTLLFYQPYDTTAHAAIWSGPMFRTAPELRTDRVRHARRGYGHCGLCLEPDDAHARGARTQGRHLLRTVRHRGIRDYVAGAASGPACDRSDWFATRWITTDFRSFDHRANRSAIGAP